MTLPAGSRLGPYEVLSPIGAGGMGEVYKARDTRLERVVAVKVLPTDLAATPELKARFEREAKAVSALSHPHICALYDVGSEGGVEYLVMEYLEGETLEDRIGKGPLPVEQVLKLGTQIADALERAHRQGIVHRDLKPGNVMLTRSGVKLLDFGLAKSLAPASGLRDDALSSLPTSAEPSRLTERGTIMGTFQYMSPEQLEGKDADARSDIFALGAVLYEMATGKKAFSGTSRASLISSILRDEPRPISAVVPMTPPAFDRVVRTCLAKDPDDRFQTAHDVKLQLEWIAEAGSPAGAPAVVVSRRKSRERLAWIVAGGAIVAALALAGILARRSPAPARTVRAAIELPAGAAIEKQNASLALSPDGRMLAFVAEGSDGKTLIYLRALDSVATPVLAGTDDASYPFWSPDGRSLGFFADGKLKRIEVSGGAVQTICEAPQGRGATWGPDGTIVFTPNVFGAMERVPASGGTPVAAESEIP
ncbi:MAG TPA: protein kinase, partial [Thermoanaerobaculia bacterium]|nr:protein kinase [Thermoanaerobaculia bacterium]